LFKNTKLVNKMAVIFYISKLLFKIMMRLISDKEPKFMRMEDCLTHLLMKYLEQLE